MKPIMSAFGALGLVLACLGLNDDPNLRAKDLAEALAPRSPSRRARALPIQQAPDQPLRNLSAEGSALDALRANPSPDAAIRLLREKGWLSPSRELERIDFARHERDWLTVFFQWGVEAERWGVLLVPPDQEPRLFEGDRCLWGAPEEHPAGLLWLPRARTPILTMREFEGGSGGQEESLRLIRWDEKGWTPMGALRLSHAWRSARFPELAGAETPYEQREVQVDLEGALLRVIGEEETVRRLPDGPEAIRYERLRTKVEERYSLSEGKLERVTRRWQFLSRHEESINRSRR